MAMGGVVMTYFSYLKRKIRSFLLRSKSAMDYMRSNTELRKEITEQYPDPVSSKTIEDLPLSSRGLLHNEVSKCTACGDCVKICPTQAISMKSFRVDSARESQQNWISEFKIDYSKCLFCGYCVETCQPMSLKHTKKYEFAGEKSDQLSRDFGRGTMSEEYARKVKSTGDGHSVAKGTLW